MWLNTVKIGSLSYQVMLVHPSEAVTVLRRLNIEQPDRVYFESLFRSGSVSQTTICNIYLRPTQQPLCNYTDLRTGEPWFCYKPNNLSCDARVIHHAGGCTQKLKAKEEKLFQRWGSNRYFVWLLINTYTECYWCIYLVGKFVTTIKDVYSQR